MELPKTYDEARKQAFSEEGKGYPGRALVRMILEPGFNRAKNKFLPYIRAINEAHLVMLAEQDIVSPGDAARIMAALEAVDDLSYKDSTYTGRFEDLYFEMEDEIIRATDGIGGNLHLARSRNDMCCTWAHMEVRDEILALIRRLIAFQNTIRLFAAEHRDTLYVIHTHTQHAQPGLLGHYFLGMADVVDRNIKRLQRAYDAANVSPMGAAAITTSGFPISRERVAELAGFSGPIENAYDAIGNCDYLTETAAAVGLCALDLGRVVTDLVTWATDELGMIRLADGYISTSSIMPQKRNPIALEHLRSSLSVVKGLADAVQLGYLKSPYGDISDREDVEDTMAAAFEQLDRNLQLFNAVIATLDVNRELLAKRARESFSVVTEIADEMVRSYRIPFRKAHHFVARLVKLADERNYDLLGVSRDFFADAYQQVFGEPFAFDFAPIQRAMDPKHFVACRDVLGGTGPNAMAKMLAGAERKIEQNAAWLQSAVDGLHAADDKRRQAIQRILAGKESNA